jgi:hypothetical protein
MDRSPRQAPDDGCAQVSIPVQDINDHKNFDLPDFAGRSDHTSFYFNPGHPGVPMPHYHFVIWLVSKKGEASVAR